MDLKRLKYFCTIIEQRSISKAANVLNMAQPPLSQRLKELEDEVGTALIERKDKTFMPTEAGMFLYSRACEILKFVDDTKQRTIEIASANKKSTLRIGVSYLYRHYFRPLLSELENRLSRTDLALVVTDSSQLESLLAQGKIDVALLQEPRDLNQFEILPFRPITPIAVLTRGLTQLPDNADIAMREIGAHPMVLLKRMDGAGTCERILQLAATSEHKPKVVLHTTEPHLAVDILENGVNGVVVLPESELEGMQLKRCEIRRIKLPPVIFQPTMAKLASTQLHHDVTDVIEQFCERTFH